MRLIKNKLYILLLITFSFPLGGIGFSYINNMVIYDVNEPSTDAEERNFNLFFEDNGLEQGFNFFVYFDALPLGLAIEYSKEFKYQKLLSTVTFNQGSEISILNNPSYSGRESDYFTVKRDLMDLSIPILAKVALSIGGGVNTHKYVVPSISLLNEIYNTQYLDDLFDAAEQNWDSNDVYDMLANNAMDAYGIHIQFGIQAKVLMLNAFINAKYTIITKDDNNSIDNFPGLTLGLAYSF